MKSDSFDPSETESSTSERTSVEGERGGEEEERSSTGPMTAKEPSQYSTATIKPKMKKPPRKSKELGEGAGAGAQKQETSCQTDCSTMARTRVGGSETPILYFCCSGFNQ